MDERHPERAATAARTIWRGTSCSAPRALALGIVIGLPLGDLAGAPSAPALAGAGGGELRPDHSGTGAAGAVLSAAARAFDVHRSAVRLRRAGARLPALAAGAHALFDAADPAQRRRRPDRPRSGRDGSGKRGRHDVAATALPRRSAAGGAGRDGGNPHRRGLDHRSRDALHLGRPDQPRQLHLHRPADRELDLRAVRLRGRGRVCTRGRSGSRPDRGGRDVARRQAHLARRRAYGGRRGGRAAAAHDAAPGQRIARLPGGRQELQRAIHPGRAHLGATGRRGRFASSARRGLVPRSLSGRSPAPTSTSMWIIRAPCGQTCSPAATRRKAPPC